MYKKFKSLLSYLQQFQGCMKKEVRIAAYSPTIPHNYLLLVLSILHAQSEQTHAYTPCIIGLHCMIQAFFISANFLVLVLYCTHNIDFTVPHSSKNSSNNFQIIKATCYRVVIIEMYRILSFYSRVCIHTSEEKDLKRIVFLFVICYGTIKISLEKYYDSGDHTIHKS